MNTTRQQEQARLGIWVFLAGELLFFGVPLLAYAAARLHAPAGFAVAGSHTDLLLGTLNTALLLTSSLAVAVAAETRARPALPLAALLGAAFLAVKALEYRHEWGEGLFPGPGFALAGTPGAELFFTWYFTVTALHALHLAIGIVLVTALASGRAPRSWLVPVALYWHFVDVVWIVLYPLIYLVGTRGALLS